MAQAEAMLRLRARALCTVPATATNALSSSSQWLAGTTALRDENELALFTFDDATADQLVQSATWLHPDGEIWDVAVCPARADRVATAFHHTRGGGGGAYYYGAAVFAAEQGAPQLQPLARLLPSAADADGGGGGSGELDAASSIVRRVVWSASDAAQLLTVQAGALLWWAVGGADAQQQQQVIVERSISSSSSSSGSVGVGALWSADLHPTQPQLAAAAADGGLFLYDARQAAAAVGAAPNAHALATRSVSWAPRNEHRLATGGDDGWLRFWDTRLLSRPALQLRAHSHWVWDVRFSPHYDQLLLTASSDTTAALWFTPALARRTGPPPSAAAADGSDGWDSGGPSPAKGAGAAQQLESQQQRPASRGGSDAAAASADGRALLVDDHEDAVHRAAWAGAADAWAFATLSYDGRLAVSRVPRGVKYKVLI